MSVFTGQDTSGNGSKSKKIGASPRAKPIASIQNLLRLAEKREVSEDVNFEKTSEPLEANSSPPAILFRPPDQERQKRQKATEDIQDVNERLRYFQIA